MIIYIDIVFLENVLINYIILFSTAIISKSKINPFRILLASSVGGIYSILNYIANLNIFLNLIIKIIISVVIVYISFRTKKIKYILKQICFFYMISFMFGGVAFMLLFFINPKNIIIDGNHFIGTYALKVTIIGSFFSFVIVLIISKLIKDRLSKKTMLCDLEIYYKGKYKKIKTLIDTGNLLKEPISQADVIIVEKNSLKDIIDTDILNNLSNIINGKWLESDNSKIYSYKFKIIPFSSLGNENGILIGFKPDYIKIYNELENIRDDVFIGIYDGKLCKTNLYTSLIGLDILKKGDSKNEFVKKIKVKNY